MADDPTAAVVITLQSTRISVCSFGSIVNKGDFQGSVYECENLSLRSILCSQFVFIKFHTFVYISL